MQEKHHHPHLTKPLKTVLQGPDPNGARMEASKIAGFGRLLVRWKLQGGFDSCDTILAF